MTFLKQQPVYELGLHVVVFRDQNMCAPGTDCGARDRRQGDVRVFPHLTTS
ncbi:hypothetical protein [Streptomyces sp. HC307]|uniref:hypothetical protein n=1 Tax=Streptomyces flavusporus TaxID=3385496 RepID=UPI0039172455